jgi:hypothetical protein
VYVVLPPGSGASTAAAPAGVTPSSCPVVILGPDLPRRGDEQVIVHETLHLLGLPDLYFEEQQGILPFPFRAWDVMSDTPANVGMSAWTRAALGWLRQDNLRCVSFGPVTAVLSPLGALNGIGALVAQTGEGRAIVAELREAVGVDASICEEGVLVYKVDEEFRAAWTQPFAAPRVRIMPISSDVRTYRRNGRCVGGDVMLTGRPGADSIDDVESGVRVRVELIGTRYRVTMARWPFD